jgi:hypothetical protein
MASDAEKPPLFFRRSLSSLIPANRPAEDAMKAIDGVVRVRVTRVNRNQRRRAFYWVALAVAADALHDQHGIGMDAELLHATLKVKLKLGEDVVLPSGEVIFKPRSTSDASMSEIERAAWTDRCVSLLARWLGVEMHVLMDEARARDAATF